jgi:hypothetical protein
MIIEAGPLLGTIDKDGATGSLAAQGQAALMNGDTTTAKQKYTEAGMILEGKLVGASRAERDMVRFLAASQFYYGGEYQKALKLAERVQEANLPDAVRQLFPTFFRSVKRRATPGYAQSTRNQLSKLWLGSDLEAVNRLLQEHPYVIEPAGIAYIRVYVCGKAGDYRASVAFALTAIRLRRDVELDAIIGAVAVLLDVSSNHQRTKSLEYSTYLAKEVPHTVTFAAAALVHAISAKDTVDSGVLGDAAVRYYDQAQTAFQHMPIAWQKDPEVRGILIAAYQALLEIGKSTSVAAEPVSHVQGLKASDLMKKFDARMGKSIGGLLGTAA